MSGTLDEVQHATVMIISYISDNQNSARTMKRVVSFFFAICGQFYAAIVLASCVVFRTEKIFWRTVIQYMDLF